MILSAPRLWKDASIGCSLELLVYFHQGGCNFSLYPSVQNRVSGIFLPLLIVPLSDGSFLIVQQFMNGIASIHNNKIDIFPKYFFVCEDFVSKIKNTTSVGMSSQSFQINLKRSLRVKEKPLVVISAYIYGQLIPITSVCTDLKLFLFLFAIRFSCLILGI